MLGDKNTIIRVKIGSASDLHFFKSYIWPISSKQ